MEYAFGLDPLNSGIAHQVHSFGIKSTQKKAEFKTIAHKSMEEDDISPKGVQNQIENRLTNRINK